MLRKLLFFGLMVSVLTSVIVKADYLQVDSMEKVLEIVEASVDNTNSENVLVCFDVDLTLTVTSELAAQWPSIQAHKLIFREIFKKLSPLEGNILLNLSTKTQSPVLIDENAPVVIQNLISKGIKVIALTDSMTGSLGDIKSVKDWRVQVLEDLNINFKPSFPECMLLKFSSLTKRTGRHPQFYKGVLLTDSGGHKEVTKGTVLVSFLESINYRPRVVIMLDDRVKYLKFVKEALADFNPSIQFIGIEYTGGHKFSTGEVTAQEFRKFWQNLAKKAQEEAEKVN